MLNIKGYIFLVRTVTLTFPVHELSALDWSEKWFLTRSSFTIWSIWMKLHRYVDHQRLHIVGKDRHSYLSRLWVIHPWLIWELVSSVRAHCFRSITWVLMHRIFSNFAYILLLGMSGGQNPTIFDGVTALSPFKKWFLACYSFTVYDIWMKLHRYVEQQRLHITTKDRHSYLSSSWVIRPWLIWKMFLTCSSFTIWNIWMKLHRYVDHQRLHIVTKDVISLSISVLLLFRHYISHKITFGAPSSGGVLCSACGAFIPSICPSCNYCQSKFSTTTGPG